MKSNIIKFIYLFQIWALLSSSLLSAQTVVTIGTGTTTSENYPFNGYYNYSWSNVIYKASDIGTDGFINTVAFYVDNTRSSNYVMNSQKIYARHTTSNAYTSATYPGTTGFTLVYDGTITYNANTTGWKQITLTTPFLYNGTDNLEFLFENRDGSYIISGFPYFRCTTGLADIQTRRDYRDAQFPSSCYACGALTVIPNIQLTIQPCGITLGTVSASPSTLAIGAESTLSITGQDQTSTLQWQSSTDNTTFTNIAGATNTTYATGALYENKYYRVQQSNNGCVKYTTSALVTIDISMLTTSTIGTGTTLFDKYPFNGYYNYSWSSIIYKATEINSSGKLARVSFYVDNSPVNFVMDNQKIYVRHTTATGYATTTYPSTTGFTLVYDGSITYNGTGWKEIALTNLFDYNGTDNLEFLFENRDGSYGTDYPLFRGQTGMAETRVKRDYYDPSFPSTCNLCASYTNILNIKMKFVPCVITLGTVAASPVSILPGAASTISITGQEQGATIQWQSSTDNINFTDIGGATSASYATGALYDNKYYRAQVTKNGCSKFTASTLVTIDVSTLTTSTIGTGTAYSEKYPYNGYYNYSWSSAIYTAGEIGSSGKLSRVSFNVYNSPVNIVMDNQKIYVRHTTTNGYTESAYPGTTGFTLVYDGSITYNGSGWKEIVLNNLFDYNGIDNLEFLFENRDGSYSTDYPKFLVQTDMSENRVKRDFKDASFPASCNLCAAFNNLLNIKMKFLPCDYTAGTVVAASDSVFPGNTTTVSISGQDPAATIQWQSSLDNINFTSISGATSAQCTTLGSNQDKYYRVQLLKSGCAKLSNAAIVAIDVSMLTTASIGTGTALFDKYPFDGYYNYSWSSIIYKASEINVAGKLSRVSFYVDNSPVNSVMNNQKIYVRHTSVNGYVDTTYPGTTGFTLVYDGSITYNGTGWKEIVLDNTFDYNGTDNLEFLFENRDGSYTLDYPVFRGQGGMTENRVKRDYNDPSFPSSCVACAAFNNILNIRMKFQPNESVGYFRSVQNGNWDQISTWQSSADNITWRVAGIVPGYQANTITIQGAHTVTITTSTTIDQTIVDGRLVYGENAGSTLTINDGTGTDLTVNGTFENNGSNLILNGTITSGASNSLFVFSGNVQQTISGNGTISLLNVQLNKSSTSAKVALQSTTTITGVFTFIKGDIITSATTPLIFTNTASVTGASNNSFISGPVKKVGNTAFTFPLGDTLLSDLSAYHPLTITAPSIATDAFTAQYFALHPDSLNPIVDSMKISTKEYWTIARTAGSSNVLTTLNWNSNNALETNSYDVVVAGLDVTSVIWKSLEKTNIIINGSNGSVTASISPFWNGTTAIPITIGKKKDILISQTVIEPYCVSGQTTGSIDMTVNYGAPPFHYSWSNSATTQDLTNLITNTYSLTITDRYSRTFTKSFKIENCIKWSALPSTLSIDNDGTIQKTSGEDSWENGNIQSDVILSGIQNGQWLKFTVADTSSNFLVGFGSVAADSLADEANMKVFIEGTQLTVIETDNDGFYSKQVISAVHINDVIKIELNDSKGILYYKNDNLIYTGKLLSDVRLQLSASIYGTNNKIKAIRCSSNN